MRFLIAPLILLASTAAQVPPPETLSRQEQMTRCHGFGQYSADQIIAACTRVIASNSGDNREITEAFVMRGFQYRFKDEFERSISDFDEAIRRGDKSAYAIRGQTFLEMKDYQHAISDYSAAIALDPSESSNISSRGHAYFRLGNYKLALADYDRSAALGFSQSACRARADLGIELDRARAYCDESILQVKKSKLPGLLGGAFAARALVGLRQKRYQDAWDDYTAALLDGPSPESLFGRGVAALRLGRAAEGQADIAKARQLDPKIAEGFASEGVMP